MSTSSENEHDFVWQNGSVRTSCRYIIVALGVCTLWPTLAVARPLLQLPSDTPASYRQLHQLLYGRDPQTGRTSSSVKEYLEQSQGGGVRMDISVNGRIADIQGLPGRAGIWNGNLPSGMAVREDTNGDGNRHNDFIYPENAKGLTIATNHSNPACNELLQRVEGPDGCRSPEDCDALCTELNEATYPVFRQAVCVHRKCEEIPPDDQPTEECEEVCIEEEDANGEIIVTCFEECTDKPVDDQPTEPECFDEVYFTDDFEYYDGRDALNFYNCNTCIPEDTNVNEANGGLEYVGDKYQCTGEWDEMQSGLLNVPYGWVWGSREKSAIALPQECLEFWVEEEFEYPNCLTCGAREDIDGTSALEDDPTFSTSSTADDCRCALNDSDGFPNEYCSLHTQVTPVNEIPYTSFFRKYIGSYRRLKTVPETENEIIEDEFSVSCFGPYKEYDPRFQQVDGNDRQCVFNIDVSTYKDTQRAPNYVLPTDIKTLPNPDSPEEQRNGGVFDATDDMWFTRLGGAFSLANKPKSGDLGPALLRIDSARISAPNVETGSLAKRVQYLRAFDDTGNRTLVTWLQEQRTKAQLLFSPSQLELVLVNPIFLGLPTEREDILTLNIRKRSKSIDTQVRTGESLLDDIVSALEDVSLLNLEQEDIPVIVPLGSPVEFRVLSEKWCLYWMKKEDTDSCATASDDVQALISRFDEYADTIEDVSGLRIVLVRHLSKVVGVQQKLVEPIAVWLNENASLYQQFIAKRSEVFALLPEWQEVERKLQDFGQRVNRPWSMNHRYTMPLDYQLDRWLPSRAQEGARTAEGLPDLPTVTPRDRIVDLSELRLPETTTLVVPVLRPIPIKLDLLDFEPPDPLSATAKIPAPPPSLPSIQPIIDAFAAAEVVLDQQPVQVLNPPSLAPLPPLPSESELAEARTTLSEMNIVLADMINAYETMWNSIGPLWPDGRDRSTVSADKEEERCRRFGVAPCVFPEMQLRETAERIGSRLGVVLAQDVISSGVPRTDASLCPPEDHTCTLLAPVDYTGKSGWQALPARENLLPTSNMDLLRTAVRSSTLPPPLGNLSLDLFPPYDVPMKELPSALRLPRDIELSPTEE